MGVKELLEGSAGSSTCTWRASTTRNAFTAAATGRPLVEAVRLHAPNARHRPQPEAAARPHPARAFRTSS